ncbi:hypothetical protein RI054_32g125230 [Pseudoscourfieldia marina]
MEGTTLHPSHRECCGGGGGGCHTTDLGVSGCCAGAGAGAGDCCDSEPPHSADASIGASAGEISGEAAGTSLRRKAALAFLEDMDDACDDMKHESRELEREKSVREARWHDGGYAEGFRAAGEEAQQIGFERGVADGCEAGRRCGRRAADDVAALMFGETARQERDGVVPPFKVTRDRVVPTLTSLFEADVFAGSVEVNDNEAVAVSEARVRVALESVQQV